MFDTTICFCTTVITVDYYCSHAIFLFFITIVAIFLFKPINYGYLRQIFANIKFLHIVSLTVKRGLL